MVRGVVNIETPSALGEAALAAVEEESKEEEKEDDTSKYFTLNQWCSMNEEEVARNLSRTPKQRAKEKQKEQALQQKEEQAAQAQQAQFRARMMNDVD